MQLNSRSSQYIGNLGSGDARGVRRKAGRWCRLLRQWQGWRKERGIVSKVDHYEVLGVRSSAGLEEIELAFKGRRSQYHPDRYTQSDSETQTWATDKMKEVNEAYRVLTKAELRKEFDRVRSQDKPRHAQPQAAAQQAKDVASILLNPKWEWLYDRVYPYPNIPRSKLEGAISSYAPNVSPDEVLVLLDDTLFGGAKEGLLVTNNAIYCKHKFDSPKRVAFDAIKRVEPGAGSRVMVNGREFFKADLIDHFAVLTFTARLSGVFKQPDSAADDLSRPEHDRNSGMDKFMRVNLGALLAIRERGADGLLVDSLIARQMGSLADIFSEVREVAQRKSRSKGGGVEAECTEIALMIFLLLHYHGYSKLPRDFWVAGRDLFERVQEICEGYKEEFVDRFHLIFGRHIDREILEMSDAFLEFDSAIDLRSKMSQEEPLIGLLTDMGFERRVSEALVRQFFLHAATWVNEFFDAIERAR